MKYVKILGLAAVAAMAMMAFAGSASATTLEVGGVAQNKSVTIEASIAAGGSAILKDTNNATVDTCTGSVVKGSTSSPFSAEKVTGAVSSLTFTGCSHKTTVLKPGKLYITWEGGTNGDVFSEEAEVTVESTIFGASCIAKTGTGTTIGTLDGVASGHATMTINGVIPMGLCGDAIWSGNYTVTSPAGLGVVN
ncbi:MAG TPA: hypothetical protein VF125_03830 [Solirubrobacterales bacterium]